MADPLRIEHVSRSYPEGHGKNAPRNTVVQDVSLNIAPGEMVCLVGPNGAGKTTTVKMASTLLLPDSGQIHICGIDAVHEPRKARAHMSLLLGGEAGFYMRMKAIDNLRFFGLLAGAPRADLEQRVAEALEAVNLSDKAQGKVMTFSRGMRQRLHIARAMLAHSSLILLDEPTTGLDPESAIQVRDLIGSLKNAGTGILLTTHAMTEAQTLADRINVIDQGRILASGTQEELTHITRLDGVTTYNATDVSNGVEDELLALPNVRGVEITAKHGIVDIDVLWQGSCPDDRIRQRFSWTRLGERPPSFEEVYLALLRGTRGSAQPPQEAK
jgi:ABC-2 type transport system ATP-binding protein